MKTKMFCLCCFFFGIMQMAVGQLSDSIPIQISSKDTLIVDSTLFFQQKLDSLTFLSESKKQELIILEDQISLLINKLSKSIIITTDSIITDVVSFDSINFSDTVVLEDNAVNLQKTDYFAEDMAEDYGFIFEITSCVFLLDTITLQLHIKGIKDSWVAPFLIGEIKVYDSDSENKKLEQIGVINKPLLLVPNKNNYVVKVFVNKKLIPKFKQNVLLIENCKLSVKIDDVRKSYSPLNIVEWNKMRRKN